MHFVFTLKIKINQNEIKEKNAMAPLGHLISFHCLLIDCYIIQTDLTLVGDITCIRQFIFKDINIILMFMQLVSIGVHNYTKLCLQLTSEGVVSRTCLMNIVFTGTIHNFDSIIKAAIECYIWTCLWFQELHQFCGRI